MFESSKGHLELFGCSSQAACPARGVGDSVVTQGGPVGTWGVLAGVGLVSDDGRKRRELALNPHFPGLQRDVTSPKSTPNPGSVLQLALLHSSVV